MRKPAFKGGRDGNSKKNLMRLIIVLAGIVAIAVGLKINGGEGGQVNFTPLTEDGIPQQITGQIIPEYRDMERALACLVDDKVYVLATRGEKSTTGYDISIESMETSEEDGNVTLIVNVLFTDPQEGASLTQEATYPYVVAETDLVELPENIEMKIQYKD